eukprot:897606-Prorocentrum_lima.AAC.1
MSRTSSGTSSIHAASSVGDLTPRATDIHKVVPVTHACPLCHRYPQSGTCDTCLPSTLCNG